MNRKKFITLWIAAALLASCSSDWEPEPGIANPLDQQPIRLTANAGETPALPGEGLSSGGQTRAASTDDLQNTAFAAGEDVAVYIVDCDNAATYNATPYRYRASAAVSGKNALTYYSDATTPSMLYFPADEASNVDIYAFYPYSRFASVSNRETTNLDVTVNADQSTADGYRASDVMIASAVTDHSRYPKNDNAVNLSFRHVMAKLILRLKQGVHAGTSSPITAAELAGSTITIGSVTTKATFNMIDGTVITDYDPVTVTVASNADLAFYYANNNTQIGTTEYAIVLPEQYLDETNTLTLTTSFGETISCNLPTIDLTAGKSSVLTLTINDSGIEATREGYGNGGDQTWYNPYTSMTAADVGKILCNDGSLYYSTSAATAAGKTPVAMVFYVGNAGETNTTYRHGLAIALTNTVNTAQWSIGGTDESTFTNIGSLNGAKADVAGLDHTEKMKSMSPQSGHRLAANEIANYTPAAPAGTSGWFMPSAGQWWLFFNSCGYGSHVGWGGSSATTADINNLNTSLVNKGVSGLGTGLYWTSSEYDDWWGVYLGLNGYGTGIILHTINKKSDLSLRPILAF